MTTTVVDLTGDSDDEDVTQGHNSLAPRSGASKGSSANSRPQTNNTRSSPLRRKDAANSGHGSAVTSGLSSGSGSKHKPHNNRVAATTSRQTSSVTSPRHERRTGDGPRGSFGHENSSGRKKDVRVASDYVERPRMPTPKDLIARSKERKERSAAAETGSARSHTADVKPTTSAARPPTHSTAHDLADPAQHKRAHLADSGTKKRQLQRDAPFLDEKPSKRVKLGSGDAGDFPMSAGSQMSQKVGLDSTSDSFSSGARHPKAVNTENARRQKKVVQEFYDLTSPPPEESNPTAITRHARQASELSNNLASRPKATSTTNVPTTGAAATVDTSVWPDLPQNTPSRPRRHKHTEADGEDDTTTKASPKRKAAQSKDAPRHGAISPHDVVGAEDLDSPPHVRVRKQTLKAKELSSKRPAQERAGLHTALGSVSVDASPPNVSRLARKETASTTSRHTDIKASQPTGHNSDQHRTCGADTGRMKTVSKQLDPEPDCRQARPVPARCSDPEDEKRSRVPSLTSGVAPDGPAQLNNQSQKLASTATDARSTKPSSGADSKALGVESRHDHAKSSREADLQLTTEAMQVESHDPIPTNALGTTDNLSPARQVERILGKYIEEMRADNEYWTTISLQRASASYEKESNVDRDASSSTAKNWFADLQPLKLSPQKKSAKLEQEMLFVTDDRSGPIGKGLAVCAWSVPYQSFSSNTRDVPSYVHYVGLKSNILAPNVTNLLVEPYFDDEWVPAEAADIKKIYNWDIDYREEKLMLKQQAEKYAPYAEAALQELKCTWSDVLRYFIETQQTLMPRGKAKKQDTEQKRKQIENFSPTSASSILILSSLAPSTSETLVRVGDLVDNFERMAKFSLWHVARRMPEAKIRPAASVQWQSDQALTCRLCLRFDCSIHGELNELHDDDEDDSGLDVAVHSPTATDIINPPNVNRRAHLTFPLEASDVTDPLLFRSLYKKPSALHWRHPKYWIPTEKRLPFYPCHHPGKSCEDAEWCDCFAQKRPCEKICGCYSDCVRRFQGCSCARKNPRCFQDERCPCWYNDRECDPDLCGFCGVCEVVDPVNRDDDSILIDRCRNCSIQRGVPKHTILGSSGVHGLGLYACEDIGKHDFVGEYKGEIITKGEAERRGAIYTVQKLSYLFSLNASQEIDSTYLGNKIRFINTDKAGLMNNLYPRVITVNTVQRIALYAYHNISAGQELFFDYGAEFTKDHLGGETEKKSAPHVRNADLVKGFANVEYQAEAGTGTLRAKAVAGSSAQGRGKSKSRGWGGARTGGGRKPRSTKHAVFQDHKAGSSGLGMGFERDAGSRLAAFNISDDGPLDDVEIAADAGAEDEEYHDEDEEDENDELEYDSDASSRLSED